MKILLATYRVRRSGAGIPSYNQELIKLLSGSNEIHVLGGTEDADAPGCVQCYTTFGHSADDFEYCSRLIGRINEANYDIIISSGSRFIPVIAPFLKAPILSVSHFVDGRFAKMAGYNSDYLNAIVALSNYGKDYIVRKFRIPDPAKVKVIYNFVNETDSEAIDKTNPDGPLKIVFPGGTAIEKSMEVMQRLVYRLVASDLDFEFYWLGISSPLPADKYTLLGLKDLKDLFPEDSRIRITGLIPREEAERILMRANIFLLPSRGEGCPMTLLEAMRGGCIAVVSDARHGSREIIEESGAGFIARQGSDRDLFRIISNVVRKHSEYADTYETSRNYLRTRLSQNAWLKAMSETINMAVGSTKKTIPLSRKAFVASLRGYKRLMRFEGPRRMLRNGWYRILIDSSFILSKLGFFKNNL